MQSSSAAASRSSSPQATKPIFHSIKRPKSGLAIIVRGAAKMEEGRLSLHLTPILKSPLQGSQDRLYIPAGRLLFISKNQYSIIQVELRRL